MGKTYCATIKNSAIVNNACGCATNYIFSAAEASC